LLRGNLFYHRTDYVYFDLVGMTYFISISDGGWREKLIHAQKVYPHDIYPCHIAASALERNGAEDAAEQMLVAAVSAVEERERKKIARVGP